MNGSSIQDFLDDSRWNSFFVSAQFQIWPKYLWIEFHNFTKICQEVKKENTEEQENQKNNQ